MPRNKTENIPPVLGYEPHANGPLPIAETRLEQIRQFTIRCADKEPEWTEVCGSLLEHIDYLQAQVDDANHASIDYFGDEG